MFIINNIYGDIIALDKNFVDKYTKKSKKASLTKISLECNINIGYEAKSNSISTSRAIAFLFARNWHNDCLIISG